MARLVPLLPVGQRVRIVGTDLPIEGVVWYRCEGRVVWYVVEFVDPTIGVLRAEWYEARAVVAVAPVLPLDHIFLGSTDHPAAVPPPTPTIEPGESDHP